VNYSDSNHSWTSSFVVSESNFLAQTTFNHSHFISDSLASIHVLSAVQNSTTSLPEKLLFSTNVCIILGWDHHQIGYQM